ncbi:MAG: hypothetical protein H6624_01465 [Bdellovibrionaceae bacterium]|nr:hypothetical protein [Bdellovibrionales bacterium]MCB9082976.1 hypothetical protein [Pseudobdellovibrionaceae bacterium]
MKTKSFAITLIVQALVLVFAGSPLQATAGESFKCQSEMELLRQHQQMQDQLGDAFVQLYQGHQQTLAIWGKRLGEQKDLQGALGIGGFLQQSALSAQAGLDGSLLQVQQLKTEGQQLLDRLESCLKQK